jgi:NAD(P) transhydrogenase subunit beta
MAGMAIAILTTVIFFRPSGFSGWLLVVLGLGIGGGIGAYMARKVQMTQMPQLVAFFHSLVGLAAVLVAGAALYAPEAFNIGKVGQIKAASLFEMALGVAIGAITFTGSIIAFLKLDGRMSGKPIMLPQRHAINIGLGVALAILILIFLRTESHAVFWLIVIVSFALGVLLIIPIGGADMPVVVSMLNSYSGWAAAGIGFTLGNMALIITGALVGSSGAILSYIMCKAMNRSFISVILGGFGADDAGAAAATEARPYKAGSAEDAAYIMKNAQKVIIVPGYGMAVARAQGAVNDLAKKLGKLGVAVRFAIHPVAGRLPGHMNVLLAEAGVPYDTVLEMDEINQDFPRTDVVLVIGANDIVNPGALDDASSPIYGMPVLEVWKSSLVVVLKRGKGAGYAGIENPLFFLAGTRMLYGDAKKSMEELAAAV